MTDEEEIEFLRQAYKKAKNRVRNNRCIGVADSIGTILKKAPKSYREKIKDPRWQRKRLLIMDRDGWACQKCRDKTKCLNVHHKFYIPGLEPWEYKDEDLVTLCEDCHEKLQGSNHERHQACTT